MRPGQQPMQYCSSFETGVCHWSSCSSISLLDQQSLSQTWIECGDKTLLALLPTASIDKVFLVIGMQFSIGKMIRKEDKIRLPCTQLVEPVTIFVSGGRNCAPWYFCVHNQIATFGLFGKQSVTLNIGLNIGYSHNRDNWPSEQSAKCNIGQALSIAKLYGGHGWIHQWFLRCFWIYCCIHSLECCAVAPGGKNLCSIMEIEKLSHPM